MTDNSTREKRELPRLLCNEGFSDSELAIDNIIHSFQSINYNRKSIGLFGSIRLPEISQCKISFSYKSKGTEINIKALPCILARSVETEVGSQYGLQFQDNLINKETTDKLIEIEDLLLKQEKNGDRYGLFS